MNLKPEKVLAFILNKIGGINLGLRIAEFILNNLEISWKVPYSGYVNDLIKQVEQIAEDGTITSNELASIIKHFRVNRE